MRNSTFSNYLLIVLQRTTNIGNSARYGGAVYVADNTNFGTCASSSYELYSTVTECSFQALTVYDSPYEDIQILHVINFEENYSYSHGPNIFGGLLDRCTISPFDAVYMKKRE